MRLQDIIMSCTEPVRVALDGKGQFSLPGGASIAAAIRGAPLRYVLDDAVAATTARVAFGDPEQLVKCQDLLRMPAPHFWMEWSESGRRAVMLEAGIGDPTDTGRAQGRAGLLVTSAPGGRSGEMRVAWESDFGGADISPFIIEFDLDNQLSAAREGNDIRRSLRISGSDPLSTLLSHVTFRLDPDWRKYYDEACDSPAVFDKAMLDNLAIVAADVPYLAGFCLLRMARDTVEHVPVDFTRLNLSRAKRGKPALLDHIEVKASLGVQHSSGLRAPATSRGAARLHFVTGHLVRRGLNVFWRRAHVRGNPQRGIISSRTVIVQAPSPHH
jgi:hypothetical protein